MNRVSPLPDGSAMVGLVSAAEPERPVDLEQLLPIRVCGVIEPERPVDLELLLPIRISSIVEPEHEVPGAVGMVQGCPGFEGELADPVTSSSGATSSQSESEFDDEYE